MRTHAHARTYMQTQCIKDEHARVQSVLCPQLEKAVGYEQRRSIRAQIRIVRRLMAEQSAGTEKSNRKPEPSSDSDSEQFSVDNRQKPTHDRDFHREHYTEIHRKTSPTHQKPFTSQEPGAEYSVQLERRLDVDDRQKHSSSQQRCYLETKQEAGSTKFQDSEPRDSTPESYSAFPSNSKPAPEKTPDWKSSPIRKQSKTEVSIELRPAPSSPGECYTPVLSGSDWLYIVCNLVLKHVVLWNTFIISQNVISKYVYENLLL